MVETLHVTSAASEVETFSVLHPTHPGYNKASEVIEVNVAK